MSGNETYDSVPTRVVRDEGQGHYTFGFVLEGAYIAVAAVKLGDVDEARARARDEAEAEAERQKAAEAAATHDLQTPPGATEPPAAQ